MNFSWMTSKNSDREIDICAITFSAGIIVGTVVFYKDRPHLLYTAKIQDQRKKTKNIGFFNTKQAALNAVEHEIKNMIKNEYYNTIPISWYFSFK